MVRTLKYDLDTDTTLGGNNASDYIAPSQKAIKDYVDNHSGGGITVDSALSTTSTNPVQNKVIASRINTINTTLGYKAEGQTTQSSTSVGYDTTAGYGSVVIGAQSFQSLASNNITLGNNIQVSDYSTDNKFIVGDQQGNGDYYEMLDLQTGLIPDARISTNIARTSQIPTVNNATLTIQKNGTTVDTFTANASSNVTANITVPTDLGDLTNNAGYTKNIGTVTSVNNVSPVNGNVTLSIPDAQVQSNWTESDNTSKAYIKNKPNLATVATSGSYSDLTGTPTIPTVNNATLTITQGGTTKGTFTANASSNVTIDIDAGGASRNIGEIVASTIPLADAGLHLLDGALIQGGGAYADFVSYIASIYDASANYFCSENDWQTAVTNYGVCGKFVYNSTNNTVRLPKITGFVEGASGVSTLGDLTEAGLPNITGHIYYKTSSGSYASLSGAFVFDSRSTGVTPSGTNKDENVSADFDAHASNPIYGNSTTVQPQSVKVLYYIVIANSTKTEIEVDIDEIATDLNGKADVDLSNATFSNSVKNTIFGFGLPNYPYRININPSSATSGSYTTTAKGYICVDFTSYNKTMSLLIGGVRVSNRTSTSSYMTSLNGMYPVEKGKIVNFENGYIATTTYSSQGIYFVPIYANVGD